MAFTFFFRDTPVLEYAARALALETAGRSRIRVWDAGCAMGQEPYTLAMILADTMGNFSFKNLYITATDIDEQDQFGRILSNGVYPESDTKRIPKNVAEKYFERTSEYPDSYRVIDHIRNRIVFQKHDLLSFQPIGDGFSLIVCKNVLLHFQQAERIEVMKMFYRCLAPGGLFASEQTQKMPSELSSHFKQIVPDAQLYRKRDERVEDS